MDVRTLCVVFTLASFHMYLNKWLIYTMSKFVGWIIDLFDNDAGSAVPKWEASDGVVLQERWVTLAAGMWPPEPTTSMTTPTRGWKLTDERVPLLVAVFSGAALVACLLCGLVLCKCCVMPRRVKHKHDCLQKIEPTSSSAAASSRVVSPAYSNHSMVLAEQKGCGSWGYTNRLVQQQQPAGWPSPWYTSATLGGPQCTQCPGLCPVPRSSSNPGSSSRQVQLNQPSTRKQRPLSQPVTSDINGEIVPKSPLPEISEFSPNSTQYASSSILDEGGSRDGISSEESTLKTRSLPSWVRSKPRPLSTEDDINDLYAKVNFSKKRKNRMRNDEAAIIAMSKSRSQFLHKDTDSLVDNEAVIVYDERTAL